MWLARNLKLEVTNYSRELYSPGGTAHPSDGDDDDEKEATPSYQLRKRQHCRLPAITKHIGIQHTAFSILSVFNIFHFP